MTGSSCLLPFPRTNVKNDIARLRRHRRSGTRIAAAAKAMPTMVQNFERDSLSESVSAVSGGCGGGQAGRSASARRVGRITGRGEGRSERPITARGLSVRTPRGFTATSEDSQCRDVCSICQPVERRPEIDPDRSIRRRQTFEKSVTLTGRIRTLPRSVPGISRAGNPRRPPDLRRPSRTQSRVDSTRGLGAAVPSTSSAISRSPKERAGAHRIGKTSRDRRRVSG